MALAVTQAAFSGGTAYLERAVDPLFGWRSLRLVYTVPAVAVAAATAWSVATAAAGPMAGGAVAVTVV